MNKQYLEKYILKAINSGYITNELISLYLEEVFNISRFKSTKFKDFINKVLSRFIGIERRWVIINNNLVLVNYQCYPTVRHMAFIKDEEFKNVMYGFQALNSSTQADLNKNLVKRCIEFKLDREKVIKSFRISRKNKSKVIKTIDYVLYKVKERYEVDGELKYNTIDLIESYVNLSMKSFLDSKDLYQLDDLHPLNNPVIKENNCAITISKD